VPAGYLGRLFRCGGSTIRDNRDRVAFDIDQLSHSFRSFQLLQVAVRLKVLRALGDGPRTTLELADWTGVPEQRLVRLLRGLVWIGALVHDERARYSLTESGAALNEPGATDELLFQGQFFFNAWSYLENYFEHGLSPFKQAHGRTVFEQISHSPESARIFNRPMSTRTGTYSGPIAALAIFRKVRHIVDVGGGEGRLMVDVLKARPEAEAVVFDLPVVRADAEKLITREGLDQRCRFIAGDMFEEVPAGGDVYLLKWILHDWDDEPAGCILQNVRRAMGKAARLIVVERLMPEQMGDSIRLAQADLNMLALNAGAERTLGQYKDLLAAAGFEVGEVVKVEEKYGFYAMIATPI
jgi:ubiquinone/menaquinone biosynthesis C-methylase UbiE